MNKHDHALLIGVNCYPKMDENQWLNYAISDVERFQKWLLSPTGGNMDEGNISTLCFPDEEISHETPQPNVSDYRNKFGDYIDKAEYIHTLSPGDDEVADNDLYVDPDGKVYLGRRIYLYFSGHGFANVTNKDDNAMLTADGDYYFRFGNHINGWKYSQYLEAMGVFKEIVLLMDCCRTVSRDLEINLSAPGRPLSDNHPRVIRTMRAYSSSHAKSSREDKKSKGGIFTTYLIKALENAPATNDNNEITYESFKAFFKNLTKDVKQGPTVSCGFDGEDIVLAVKESFNEVTLTFSDECIGKTLFIMNSSMQKIEELTQEIQGPNIALSLKTGFYGYVVKGTDITGGFDVSQNIEQHVG